MFSLLCSQITEGGAGGAHLLGGRGRAMAQHPPKAASWGGAGLPPLLLYLWHHTLRGFLIVIKGHSRSLKPCFGDRSRAAASSFSFSYLKPQCGHAAFLRGSAVVFLMQSAVRAVCQEEQGRLVPLIISCTVTLTSRVAVRIRCSVWSPHPGGLLHPHCCSSPSFLSPTPVEVPIQRACDGLCGLNVSPHIHGLK